MRRPGCGLLLTSLASLALAACGPWEEPIPRPDLRHWHPHPSPDSNLPLAPPLLLSEPTRCTSSRRHDTRGRIGNQPSRGSPSTCRGRSDLWLMGELVAVRERHTGRARARPHGSPVRPQVPGPRRDVPHAAPRCRGTGTWSGGTSATSSPWPSNPPSGSASCRSRCTDGRLARSHSSRRGSSPSPRNPGRGGLDPVGPPRREGPRRRGRPVHLTWAGRTWRFPPRRRGSPTRPSSPRRTGRGTRSKRGSPAPGAGRREAEVRIPEDAASLLPFAYPVKVARSVPGEGPPRGDLRGGGRPPLVRGVSALRRVAPPLVERPDPAPDGGRRLRRRRRDRPRGPGRVPAPPPERRHCPRARRRDLIASPDPKRGPARSLPAAPDRARTRPPCGPPGRTRDRQRGGETAPGAGASNRFPDSRIDPARAPVGSGATKSNGLVAVVPVNTLSRTRSPSGRSGYSGRG